MWKRVDFSIPNNFCFILVLSLSDSSDIQWMIWRDGELFPFEHLFSFPFSILAHLFVTIPFIRTSRMRLLTYVSFTLTLFCNCHSISFLRPDLILGWQLLYFLQFLQKSSTNLSRVRKIMWAIIGKKYFKMAPHTLFDRCAWLSYKANVSSMDLWRKSQQVTFRKETKSIISFQGLLWGEKAHCSSKDEHLFARIDIEWVLEVEIRTALSSFSTLSVSIEWCRASLCSHSSRMPPLRSTKKRFHNTPYSIAFQTDQPAIVENASHILFCNSDDQVSYILKSRRIF